MLVIVIEAGFTGLRAQLVTERTPVHMPEVLPLDERTSYSNRTSKRTLGENEVSELSIFFRQFDQLWFMVVLILVGFGFCSKCWRAREDSNPHTPTVYGHLRRFTLPS